MVKKGIDYIGISVGALIINGNHEILLCKRSQNARNERGCWEAPGGGVKFGETLEEAIKREMKEELGIEINILDQFIAHDHLIPLEHQHWVPTSFLCTIKKGQTPKIQESEKCDAIQWFPLDNLPSPLSIITVIDIAHYREKYADQFRSIGRFMVAVGAIVKHPKNNTILILHRSASSDFQQQIWEIPYGRIAQFENPEQGLRRELKEETGLTEIDINPVPQRLWHIYRGEKKKENEIIGMTFVCKAKTDKITLSKEHDEYRWETPSVASSLSTISGIKEYFSFSLLVSAIVGVMSGIIADGDWRVSHLPATPEQIS